MKPTTEQELRITEVARKRYAIPSEKEIRNYHAKMPSLRDAARQRKALPTIKQLAEEMGLPYYEVRKVRNAELQRIARARKREGTCGP
jgi:hypothetical protein